MDGYAALGLARSYYYCRLSLSLSLEEVQSDDAPTRARRYRPSFGLLRRSLKKCVMMFYS